jgi:hypothetical protein
MCFSHHPLCPLPQHLQQAQLVHLDDVGLV